MEILHLENVSFRYPKAAVNALDGVSFSVQSGEFVVVCGASAAEDHAAAAAQACTRACR